MSTGKIELPPSMAQNILSERYHLPLTRAAALLSVEPFNTGYPVIFKRVDGYYEPPLALEPLPQHW